MNRSEQGFMLVEVLLAAAVMAVVALALLRWQQHLVQQSLDQSQYMEALRLAEDKATELRSHGASSEIKFDAISDNYPESGLLPNTQISRNGWTFKLSWTVTPHAYLKMKTVNITVTPESDPQDELAKLEVKISDVSLLDR